MSSYIYTHATYLGDEASENDWPLEISAALIGSCVGYLRETIGRRMNSSGQNVIPGILNWLEMDDILALVDGQAIPPIGASGEVVRNVVLDPERLKAGTAIPQ